MNDIDMKKVSSIEFTVDGSRYPKMRFVINPHRKAMYKMQEWMENHDCEPLLVVDRDDKDVWWSDDYMFVIDQMCIDESEREDAYSWALMVTECKAWWPCEEGVIFRTREGTVIRAQLSTMPCDRVHGQCTNDCVPIDEEV